MPYNFSSGGFGNFLWEIGKIGGAVAAGFIAFKGSNEILQYCGVTAPYLKAAIDLVPGGLAAFGAYKGINAFEREVYNFQVESRSLFRNHVRQEIPFLQETATASAVVNPAPAAPPAPVPPAPAGSIAPLPRRYVNKF